MKTLLASIALAVAGTANAASTVAPGPEWANTEGPDNGIILGHPFKAHIQLIVSRTLFGSDVINLTGFAWRKDSSTAQGQLGTYPFSWGNSIIKMATISNLGAAVETYAQNLGADTKTVLSGALNSVVDNGGPGAGPRNWNAFTFQNAFTYDPSAGDLVLDVEMLEASELYFNADWVFNESTVIVVNGESGAVRGNGAPYSPVTRFDFDVVPPVFGGGPSNDPGGVPEPATWAMLLSGFGLAGTALRRSSAGQRPLAA